MLGEHTGLQDMGVAAGCKKKVRISPSAAIIAAVSDFNSVRHYARRQGMITPSRNIFLAAAYLAD